MKSILLVEDDESLNQGITLKLKKEGYRVSSAFSLEEAEELFDSAAWDLLICDVGLPDGSGLDFCRRVRRVSDVYILFLTALDSEIDMVTAYDLGADDYMTKPFSLMVLRARIRALLRRTEKGQEKEYLQPPFAFHFASMEFYKEGRPVELSKTEQRILYLLVFNPGQIITRERLLEWVWPDGTEYVEDNALSVGIRRLRDKLEEDASKPVYIRTVYGKGYVWEMPV